MAGPAAVTSSGSSWASQLLYGPVFHSLVTAYYFRSCRDLGLIGRGALRMWHSRLALESVPSRAKNCLWLHLAGPGDARAGLLLINRLRDLAPDLKLLLTCGTVSAWDLIVNHVGKESDFHYACWQTFDWTPCVRRFLRRYKPIGFVAAQGEFWPMTLRELNRLSLPVVYLRVDMFDWDEQQELPLLLKPLYQVMLTYVDFFSVRRQVHAANLRNLGIPEERISCGGDYRLEQLLTPCSQTSSSDLKPLVDAAGNRKIVVLAGLRLDELAGVVPVLFTREICRGVLFIVAQVERDALNKAQTLLKQAGLLVTRRSSLGDVNVQPDAIMLDTHGELGAVYAVSDLVIIGDTFAPVFGDGRNYWEPLQMGVRILGGPSLASAELLEALRVQGWAVGVASFEELGTELYSILRQSHDRERLQRAVIQIAQHYQSPSTKDAISVLSFLRHEMEDTTICLHPVRREKT